MSRCQDQFHAKQDHVEASSFLLSTANYYKLLFNDRELKIQIEFSPIQPLLSISSWSNVNKKAF